MALEGAKNANIALTLGISVEDVHTARSRLGYTIEKASEMKTSPCGCCGAPVPDDEDYFNHKNIVLMRIIFMSF